MKISELGTLAAVVREGDYLVFCSNQTGVHVEYSPSATPGAPVIGAFASRKGALRYLDAREAGELVQNYSLAAEEHLVRSLELSPNKGKQTLTQKVILALQTYADAGYQETAENPVWDGRLVDFHREIIYPATGVAYSPPMISALRRVGKRLPGVTIAKTGREHFITVEWGAVATATQP
jgi:hypothetical protein